MTDDSNEAKPFFFVLFFFLFSFFFEKNSCVLYDYLFEFPPEYTLQLCRAEVGLPVVLAAGHRAFLRVFFFFFVQSVKVLLFTELQRNEATVTVEKASANFRMERFLDFQNWKFSNSEALPKYFDGFL